MKRHFYLVSGWASLGLGALGAFLPLLPTVPFVILAAFCFARSSPRLEAWLVTHPQFGHHIVAWREKGAISRKGKIAATAAFALSIVLAAIFSPWPWVMAPVIAAAVTGRSEEHTSELQSLMRNSYAVFCLKKNKTSYSSASSTPSTH